MKNAYFLVFFMTVFVMTTHAEEFYVEGIVFEASSPEKSMAVINGEPLTKGAKVGAYTITEIQQDQVHLTSSSGEIKKIGLSGKPSIEAPAMRAEEEELVRSSPLAEEKDLIKEVEEIVSEPKINFADMISFAQYAAVQANLRNVQTAAMIFYSDYAQIPTIQEAVKAGLLSPSYEDGEHQGYVFRIENHQGEPAVFAEPKNPSSNKRSFFIDKWGEMKSYRKAVETS